MKDGKGRVVTAQKVPFFWSAGKDNVAFTSIWDNYPAKIDFPVNQSGDAAYFLVSGSTNVMQCQIANAVIRLSSGRHGMQELNLTPL